MQMVLKATDQRGKVPWQETLIPSDNPKWQVCPNTLYKPGNAVEFSGEPLLQHTLPIRRSFVADASCEDALNCYRPA